MITILEIIGLIIAVGAIITLARGRGASPLIAGTVAVAGWAALEIGAALFIPLSDDSRVWLMVAAWGWIGAVALFVRFVVGASRSKPDSKWNCSNCRYLNSSSSVICEACGQPWQSPASQTAQAGR
jgi:hypothetical protein